MKKQTNTFTIADCLCDTRSKKIKKQFFHQINNILDWKSISTLLDKHCPRGKNAVGQASYDNLLLFKMSLLQTWYGLSDYEVEDRINDSISFSYFCGLAIDQVAPDHSTLSRFRTAMTEAKVYDKLMKLINQQLEKQNIIIRKGVLVDASVVDTPKRPKGKTTHEVKKIKEEGIEDEGVTIEKTYPTSVDKDASWVKKRGKIHFGYKKHYLTDEEGLVLGVVTTTASTHEISNLEEVLNTTDLPDGIALKADKGYQSVKNAEILKKNKLKNHILKKAKKNNPLSEREKAFNKSVGKTRFKVERTFGSIKRWFNGGLARYEGLSKMHTQNVMEAIGYNLYRSPGIIASL